MNTREILTVAQIQTYIDKLQEKGIAVVSTIYQELYAKGYAYAGWADGVATGDAITGQAALDFMQSSAGITMTAAQITMVRISMLKGYLTSLYKIADDNQTKTTNQDVDYKTAKAFHIVAFKENGLTIDNWTLEAPMKVVEQYLGGEEKVEELWGQIRETEGTYADAWAISAQLYSMMDDIAKFGFIYVNQNGEYIPFNVVMSPDQIVSMDVTKKTISSTDIDTAELWVKSTFRIWAGLSYFEQLVNSEKVVALVGDEEQSNQNDTIYALNGNILGNHAAWTYFIYGLGGADKLIGLTGIDYLYGGTGNDELKGGNNHDYLYGGINNDHLYGEDGNDYLDGGNDNDQLYGGDGQDHLVGGEEDDLLDGGDGDDKLIDESGNETYIFNGNFGHDTIYDQDGSGQIKIDGVTLTVGEKVNNKLWKSADGQYTIALLEDLDGLETTHKLIISKDNENNNSITIKYFNNGALGLNLDNIEDTTNPPEDTSIYAFGTDGNNIIFDQRYVASFAGNDFIHSTNEDAVIIAGDGNDLISTGEGNDIIYAGVATSINDNNIIFSGDGRDQVYGGVGNDIIMTSNILNNIQQSLLNNVGSANSGDTEFNKEYNILNFNFEMNLNEYNDYSYYIYNNLGQITEQILPLFDIYYTGLNGNNYFYNLIAALNYGHGYSGSDIAYGGTGNDIILGSSETDFLYGGVGDDAVYGMDGNDYLYGGDNKDTVYGGDGNDEITGGSGEDELVGGLERDEIYGGGGDDIIQADLNDLSGTTAPPSSANYNRYGNDVVHAGAGNDKIWGNLGDDEIYGDDDDDEIHGDHHAITGNFHGADKLFGGNGEDKIWGDGGNDVIKGGNGDDTISGDNVDLDGQYHGADTIDGDAGNDTIWGQGGKDSIHGGDGDDTISGDSSGLDSRYHADDKISGDGGDDHIAGDGGNDEIYGGEGKDRISGDNSLLEGQLHGRDKLYGGADDDLLWGDGGKDELYGGEGNDYIQGDANNLNGQYHGDDTLYGDGGNDNLRGDGGSDILYGGDGDDSLIGDLADNRAFDGNDQLYGGKGSDSLSGYDGNDTLDGGEGDDIVFGGKGDDTFISNEGNDQLAGGEGDDTYHIRVRDSVVKVLDSSGENHYYLEGDFDLSKMNIYWYSNAVSLITPTQSQDPNAVFPQFKLTFFDDSETQPIVGGGTVTDEYGNNITGGYDQYLHFNSSGYNTTTTFNNAGQHDYVIHLDTYLKERAGLSYNVWNGSWYGIQGPYLIFTNGYIENNNLIYESSELGDVIDIAQVRDNVSLHGEYQADEYHLLGGNDEVQGSSLKDIVYGGAGDDIIHAKDGNDELYGDEGSDQLFGEIGDDLIDGGQGDDSITGDQGNDQMFGGDGNDLISGGDGDDEISGDDGADRLFGGNGSDLINGGDGDDELDGGAGQDTYIFDINSGFDTIDDSDRSIIQFNNISPENISLAVMDNYLKIYYAQDKYITVKDFLNRDNIEEIRFDNNVWNNETIKSKILIEKNGTLGDDILSSKGVFSNKLQGLDGNDSLYGGSGYHYLYGGLGDDNLITSSISGTLLDGGLGYDQYNISSAQNILIKDEDGQGEIILGRDALYIYIGGIGHFNNQLISRETYQNSIYSVYDVDGVVNTKLNIEHDAQQGKVLIKFLDGQIYFSIDNIYNLSDIVALGGLDIHINDISLTGYYYTSNPSLVYYDSYIGMDFKLIDFLQSKEILSTYSNDDDTIIEDVNNAYDGNRTLNMLGGDDVVSIKNQGYVNADLGDGNDQITIVKGEVKGGEGSDSINILETGTVFGENGDDQINIGSGNIYGGDGEDQITIIKGVVKGGEGSDYINMLDTGTVFGENGDDQIISGSGDVYGGDGNDIINIQHNATVYGGEGDDEIIGGDSSNTLYGGNGNDSLIGHTTGINYLDGGDGADILKGGSGDDTYIVDELDTLQLENEIGGYDTIIYQYDVGNIDLANSQFEAVELFGYSNSSLLGNAENNKLIGNNGNNYLDGRTGSDYMAGREGDDYYVVDVTDTVATDEDGYTYIVDGDQVEEDFGSGIDTIERWQDARFIGQDENGNPVLTNSYRLLEDNIENLVLKGSAKTAFGNDLNNIIIGNSQDNYIDGLDGNDTYVFAKGGGTDTYSFEDSIDAVNILKIQGYSANEVFAQKYGDSVYLSFKGTSDHIWLSNYYIADTEETTYQMDQIIFDSGTTWTSTDIDALVNRALTNNAPTVNAAIPMITSNQGAVFSYKFASNVIIDQDSWDSLSYGITLTTTDSSGQYQPIPSWLSFDAATQTLSGTPPSDVTGNLSFFYWGTDMYGFGTGTSFTLKVNLPNQAPTVLNTIADQSVTDAKAFSYTVPSTTFKDPDGDALTYTATLEDGSPLPAWLTFNASTRVLSGTSPDNAASLNIKITVKDTANQSVSDVFKLTFVIQNLTVNGTSSVDTLYGASGNDTITGQAGNDILYGQSGNDTLNGGAGNDTMYGGKGDDIYVVDSATDIISENANEGIDTVQSSVTLTLGNNLENLTLTGTTAINATGNALNNTIIGNSAINTLTGGAGDDYLDGGAGNDKLLGGLGNDTYVVDSTSDVITENANEGTDTVRSSVTLTLGNNLENLTLTGTTAINATGNTLNNTIIGNGAINTLTGGAGDDYLDGGAGADKLLGGLGNDTYVIDNTSDTITENANEGTDTILSSITFTLGSNLENLTLTGTTAINATGNALNNIIIGNSGSNVLNGGTGNDVLDGLAGNDQFTGGTGADTLIYQLLVVSDVVGGNGSDSWSDFTIGNTTTNVNADKIDISDLLVDYTGNYSSSSIDPFIKTVVNGSNTQFYIDRDGGGSTYNSTLLLTLNNVNTNLNDLINNQQIIIG